MILGRHHHSLEPEPPRYRILRKLEKGGNSIVFSAVTVNDTQTLLKNELVAFKIFAEDKVIQNRWWRDNKGIYIPFEVQILKMANHKNIISFIDYFQLGLCYLVLETHKPDCRGILPSISSGLPFSPPLNNRTMKTDLSERAFWASEKIDLFEFRQCYHNLGESITRIIFTQVIDAVSYLHSNRLTHGDIKEENILINSNLEIKLVDFGCADIAVSDNLQFHQVFHGTSLFAPPEVFATDYYCSLKVDTWTLGILLYIMLFGRGHLNLVRNVVNVSKTLSENCAALLIGLLDIEPVTRFSIGLVLQNLWIVNGRN